MTASGGNARIAASKTRLLTLTPVKRLSTRDRRQYGDQVAGFGLMMPLFTYYPFNAPGKK